MEAGTAEVARNVAERETDAETRRLKRSLRRVIGISLPLFVVSLWPFYDQYWRFRSEFVDGNFVDPTGQARYAESIIWGFLGLASLVIGLAASWMLYRENEREKTREKRD